MSESNSSWTTSSDNSTMPKGKGKGKERGEGSHEVKARAPITDKIMQQAMDVLGEHETFRPISTPYIRKLHSSNSNSDNSKLTHKSERKDDDDESSLSSNSYSYSDISISKSPNLNSIQPKFTFPPSIPPPQPTLPPNYAQTKDKSIIGSEIGTKDSNSTLTKSKLTTVVTESAKSGQGDPDSVTLDFSSIRSELKSRSTSAAQKMKDGKSIGAGGDSIRTHDYEKSKSTIQSVHSKNETIPSFKSEVSELISSMKQSAPLKDSPLQAKSKSGFPSEYTGISSDASSLSYSSKSHGIPTDSKTIDFKSLSRISKISSIKLKTKSKRTGSSSKSTSDDLKSLEHQLVKLNFSSSSPSKSGGDPGLNLGSGRSLTEKERSKHGFESKIKSSNAKSSVPSKSYSNDGFLSEDEKVQNAKEAPNPDEFLPGNSVGSPDHKSKEPKQHVPIIDGRRRPRSKLRKVRKASNEKTPKARSSPKIRYRIRHSRSEWALPAFRYPYLHPETGELVYACIEANEEIYNHALELAKQLEENYREKVFGKKKAKNSKQKEKESKPVKVEIPHRFHHHYYY